MQTNKIILGDCLEELKKIDSDSIDVVITSPPYNKNSADRKCSPTDTWNKANIDYEVFKDGIPETEYQENQKNILRELVRIIKPTGSIFYNHKYRIVNHKVISPEEWLSEFIIRQVIIWDRGSSCQLEPIRFLPTIEQIYWITKNRETPYFNQSALLFKDIWRINAETNNDHPAPFPKELPRKCIIACCPENGIVLDPYSGSGTTLIVAKELRRNYLGIELNKKYIDMAEKRLKATTISMFQVGGLDKVA